MNNEVLRRKMFNKIMDTNKPSGILASSSELSEAVIPGSIV